MNIDYIDFFKDNLNKKEKKQEPDELEMKKIDLQLK